MNRSTKTLARCLQSLLRCVLKRRRSGKRKRQRNDLNHPLPSRCANESLRRARSAKMPIWQSLEEKARKRRLVNRPSETKRLLGAAKRILTTSRLPRSLFPKASPPHLLITSTQKKLGSMDLVTH